MLIINIIDVDANGANTVLCSTKPNSPTITAPDSEITANGSFSLRNKAIIIMRIIPITSCEFITIPPVKKFGIPALYL